MISVNKHTFKSTKYYAVILCIKFTHIILCSPDYNECRYGTHKCEGPCINTAGSYACDCTAGYRLNTGDRRSCDGMYNLLTT